MSDHIPTPRHQSRLGIHLHGERGERGDKRGVRGSDDKDSPGARIRIMDAAERLFAERGFDGTPTARIAHEAGVPKGLLFYYFPTKLDLLCALVGERLDAQDADPDSLAVPGDPVSGLVNAADRILTAQAESGTLGVIVWREEHLHSEVRLALARHRRGLRAFIRRVLTASLHGTVDSGRLEAAVALWAALVTTRPLEGLTHTAQDLRAAAEVVCAGLIPLA